MTADARGPAEGGPPPVPGWQVPPGYATSIFLPYADSAYPDLLARVLDGLRRP